MSTSQVLRVVGIVLVCVGIHFGVASLLPLIVFGCGLGFIFFAVMIFRAQRDSRRTLGTEPTVCL